MGGYLIGFAVVIHDTVNAVTNFAPLRWVAFCYLVYATVKFFMELKREAKRR